MPKALSTVARTVGRWLSSAAVALGWFGRAGVFLLMIHVVLDTFLRYAFNSPLPGTTEYVQHWYMVGIAFLGFAVAERRGEHIEAPLIFDRLPPTLQREFTFVSVLLTIGVLLFIAWWGWEQAMTQLERGERGGAARTTIWPTRFFVPLGALALAIELIPRLAVWRERHAR